MKNSKFSDSQILSILKQSEAGIPVSELCREHGMSKATFYKWRSKYGGMDISKGYTIDNITAYNNCNLDIHHIFPKSYCEKQGIHRDKYDSIINKATISYDTNRSIGGHAPSEYLAKLDINNDKLNTDKSLISQLIDPSMIRANDFDGYYQDRKSKIIKKIEAITGKNVIQ